MHELSLVESLLDIIDRQAAEHNFCRVNSVKISFGRIAAIDSKALNFAFSVQSQGTVSQGARLEMEVEPLIISCLSCGKESTMERYEPLCSLCGAWEIEIKGGGEDLRLLELDVD